MRIAFCRSGHAIVEFVVVFPLFFLLTLLVLETGFVFFRYITLHSRCLAVARQLGRTQEDNAGVLSQLAKTQLDRGRFSSSQVVVHIRDIPSSSFPSSLRQKKTIQIVELTVEQTQYPVFPFFRALTNNFPLRFRVHVREGRMRREGGGA